MIRPGFGRHVVTGPEDGVIDPDRNDRHPLGPHLHLRGDVAARRLRHREHSRERSRHPDLHAEESEPALGGESLPRVGRVRQGQLAVHRDRVVQGGQQRPTVLDHTEHAGTEALVVVDHIEVAPAFGQDLPGPPRIGQRLAESGSAHDAELDPVLAALELPRVGHPERVGITVEVEAGDRSEADSGVELGPGRPGEHLDRMSQRHQFAGQVTGVHALATTAGVAPIDQEGDPQTTWSRGCGRDRGRHLDVARALPGLLRFDPLLARRFRH